MMSRHEVVIEDTEPRSESWLLAVRGRLRVGSAPDWNEWSKTGFPGIGGDPS